MSEKDPYTEAMRDACERTEARIGKRLRELRAARGWSQAEAAEELSRAGFPVHQTAMGRMESGRRPLRVAELQALAAIYEVTLETLLISAGDDVDADQLRRDIEWHERALERDVRRGVRELSNLKAELRVHLWSEARSRGEGFRLHDDGMDDLKQMLERRGEHQED